MFVILVIYFVIITIVLGNNHPKIWRFNWWWWWWCCWRWKQPGFHHRCQIGGAKYTIHKIKAAHTLITFSNNPIWWFEGTIIKPNIPDKGRKIIHYHRVCYSDHEHVQEYPFFKLQRLTARTYLLPFTVQYLWLGY